MASEWISLRDYAATHGLQVGPNKDSNGLIVISKDVQTLFEFDALELDTLKTLDVSTSDGHTITFISGDDKSALLKLSDLEALSI